MPTWFLAVNSLKGESDGTHALGEGCEGLESQQRKVDAFFLQLPKLQRVPDGTAPGVLIQDDDHYLRVRAVGSWK